LITRFDSYFWIIGNLKIRKKKSRKQIYPIECFFFSFFLYNRSNQNEKRILESINHGNKWSAQTMKQPKTNYILLYTTQHNTTHHITYLCIQHSLFLSLFCFMLETIQQYQNFTDEGIWLGMVKSCISSKKIWTHRREWKSIERTCCV
jgi:hypothetical protein